ncbi:hypothetical protein F0L68_02745 [Solihabitans fulvus]|uniref:Uncharacterized protein n=2 Tax=Solihabitans fulvus TaxID=1892852 RepID=A0A5B2XRA7_9PSEU|nr:hypothetical protein F0L68_02745 [Solihabitans fulvus]
MLSRVPPVAAFLVVAALFGVGVWQRGPLGAALLGVLALLVLMLLTATWKVLGTLDRVFRVVVFAVLVLIALSLLR